MRENATRNTHVYYMPGNVILRHDDRLNTYVCMHHFSGETGKGR